MPLPLNAMTPRSRHVRVRAGELAERAGHRHIGTEHLLLALADDPDGIAGQVLDRLGVREKTFDETALVLTTMLPAESRSTSDPGDAATVWFEPLRLSNHPLVLSEPNSEI
jgi:ATP-dependent Clp protease ATP-binding subunit ClpA